MTILDERESMIPVKQIAIAECFEDKGSFYIRLDEYSAEGSDIKCVNMKTGYIVEISESYLVKPIIVKLEIVR